MDQLDAGNQKKSYKRKIGIMVSCLLVVLAGGSFFGYKYYLDLPRVETELTLEAGGFLPELSEFLLREYKDAAFVIPLDDYVNRNAVGDYEVAIRISGREYTSVLHIVDTVAPAVEVRDAKIYNDETLSPYDLIENIDDVTETSAVFADTPDFTQPGVQNVQILVTDEGGNTVQVSAKVEVLIDTEPPVIEGVQELYTPAGSSISYKRDVTVTDDRDEDVLLVVDNSAVNLNKVGDYPVIYSAADSSGNVTEITTVLHVTVPELENATEDIVNAEADAILAEILTEDMTEYEKAKAIFDWVYTNIANVGEPPKTTWVEGAYRGLFERKGDCFVYAMTSKCLLTRAGIENMDIGFIRPDRIHYWNLINLGEGWYHWDATKRRDGCSFFYVSDADIMAYSSIHYGSHTYDPSLYPEIQ